MIGQFEMAPMALIPPKLALGVPGSALTMFPVDGGKAAFGDFAYAHDGKSVYFVSDEPVDGVAQEFVSWRGKCQSSIRSTYQILSRGTPNLENETWNASANVIKGTETPEAAGARLQAGLDAWYKPAK